MEEESLGTLAPWGKEAPLAQARALLEAGREGEAEALLKAWKGKGPEEAERLALLGFAKARRGDLQGYRRLALEAARRAQTSFTLYHLGLALPPREGVVALEEALHRTQSPKDQGLLTLALARTKRRLGRLREALAHAALARLKAPGAFTTLEWAWLTLLAEEEPPLPDLLREVEPLALEPGPGLYARFLVAHLHLLQGEERAARAYWQKALEEAPPAALPYLAPAGVRLLGQGALPLLQAARPWAQDPYPRALLLLGEALVREDSQGVRELLPLLEREGTGEEVFRARLFLGEEPSSLGEVSGRGGWLLWPTSRASPDPHLQTLGEARLFGRPLPLRQAELLVLLLARPEGWRGEALAQALYGDGNTPALRMELHRLRERGLVVGSRPYRLLSPLKADFLEVEEALHQGNLSRALRLYRGPLLPNSQAPGVEELRWELEASLRKAALSQGSLEALYALAERLRDDLELWEALLERLSPLDPRHPAVLARVERLRREWGL
ncbi:hypothetical protein [Thermus caliditerrae]|uniref:hypothetical protein n=1 Tax=Thermus caliditerrae TaxID=1330700 RepID=UPI001F482443|nr:hypothetical protein [Thermus caliditerrae]